MFSFIAFVALDVATPLLFLNFVEKTAKGYNSISLGFFAVISFFCTSLAVDSASRITSDALFYGGWLSAITVFAVIFLTKNKENKRLWWSLFLALIMLALLVLEHSVFKSLEPEYLNRSFILLLCVLGIALSIAVIMLFKNQFAKSDVFRGFCIMVVLAVFFSIGIFVTLVFAFDGLRCSADRFVLSIDSEFIKLWWVVPASFGIVSAWELISNNVKSYFKKASGYLIAVALFLMVAGEVLKQTSSTNIVTVVEDLGEILSKDGYDPGLIRAIEMLTDSFSMFGIFFISSAIVALGATAMRQFLGYKNWISELKTKQASAVSVENMRKSDEHTIKNGVASTDLMRRAAQGIYDSIQWKNKRVAIVAGSGNNGGDGYALAEILADKGNSPVVFRISEKFSEDGKYYFDRMCEKGVAHKKFTESTSLKGFDIIVDCIFGTGFKGKPEGLYAVAIKRINKSGAFVVSADINSGLNGDSGEAVLAVKSDLTVSIGYYKNGMFVGKAPKLIGELVNVDIGIVLV